jgi:protein involved in polysaccharide export with SLBB domain
MNIWNSSLKILVSSLILISGALPAAGQKTPVPTAVSSTQPRDVDQAPKATPGDDDLSSHRRNWRYRINPSDTLELTFSLTPEFNQTVIVQPDGYITLRDVGDLQVAGKTLPEFTEAVKAAYSKILHDPVISVDPRISRNHSSLWAARLENLESLTCAVTSPLPRRLP